jgi:excisionase family DNA binding protein
VVAHTSSGGDGLCGTAGQRNHRWWSPEVVEGTDHHLQGGTMSKKNDRDRTDGEGRLPHLLRIEELAQRLGVSVRHLRRLVQERRIPSLKFGHFVMFDENEIATWLNDFRRPPEEGQRPA